MPGDELGGKGIILADISLFMCILLVRFVHFGGGDLSWPFPGVTSSLTNYSLHQPLLQFACRWVTFTHLAVNS